MTPFVSDKDLISISIFYSAGTNKYGFKTVKVVDEKKAKELMQSPDTAATVKTLNTKWKQPTWESQQKLYADSKTYNKVNGTEDTDWTVFSDIQLKTCLVDWDLQSEKGEVLPVTSDIINNLHANVANALLSKYRQITSLDGDEASD